MVVATGSKEDYRHPDHYAGLMAQVQRLRVGDRFRHLGTVGYDELMALMRDSVAVINPSLFEGWSTTVEEAKSSANACCSQTSPSTAGERRRATAFSPPTTHRALAAMLGEAWESEDAEEEKRGVRRKLLAPLPERMRAFGRTYQEIVVEAFGGATRNRIGWSDSDVHLLRASTRHALLTRVLKEVWQLLRGLATLEERLMQFRLPSAASKAACRSSSPTARSRATSSAPFRSGAGDEHRNITCSLAFPSAKMYSRRIRGPEKLPRIEHSVTHSRQRNWSGLVMDGSEEKVQFIQKDPIYWRHSLTARHAFITRENIDGLLGENSITGDIGLLSIGIDGSGYWVWEAIDVVTPRIVVVEYNSLFGPDRALTVPGDPVFVRAQKHHSNLYYGASISALAHLAERKGYALVGSNLTGNNAFFVRRDVLGGLTPVSPERALSSLPISPKRAMPTEGLTFLSFEERAQPVAELPVHDLADGREQPFGSVA